MAIISAFYKTNLMQIPIINSSIISNNLLLTPALRVVMKCNNLSCSSHVCH